MDKRGFIAYLQSLGNRDNDSIRNAVERLDKFEQEFNIMLDDFIPYNNDYSKVAALDAIQSIEKRGMPLAFAINDYMLYRLSDFNYSENDDEDFKLIGEEFLEVNNSKSEVETKDWFQEGSDWFNKGDYIKAIECCDKAIELNQNEFAYGIKGSALYKLGKNEAAIDCFDKVIEFYPESGYAHYTKGDSLQALGKYKAAIECYDEAIELDPDLVAAYNNKGNVLMTLGKHEAAIVCFDKVIELNPDLVVAHHNKGLALGTLGKHEAAIVCFDKVIELNPDHVDAHHNKGFALGALGKYEEAIVCFDKAIELKPDHVDARKHKNIALKNLGKYEKTVERFDKAIEQKSDKNVDTVVIDSKSIHIVTVTKNESKDVVLAAYMQVSGEGWHTDEGRSYNYWITTHSPTLYSIRREIKKPEGTLGFLIGDIDIADWWAQAYPILEYIANVTGAVTGVAAITSAPFIFIRWLRSKKVNKEKEEYNSWEKGNLEYAWVHNILVKDSWNISSLSNELSITDEETKKLLKGFGFVWDSHKMLYIATENTEKLRNIKPEQHYN